MCNIINVLLSLIWTFVRLKLDSLVLRLITYQRINQNLITH